MAQSFFPPDLIKTIQLAKPLNLQGFDHLRNQKSGISLKTTENSFEQKRQFRSKPSYK